MTRAVVILAVMAMVTVAASARVLPEPVGDRARKRVKDAIQI